MYRYLLVSLFPQQFELYGVETFDRALLETMRIYLDHHNNYSTFSFAEMVPIRRYTFLVVVLPILQTLNVSKTVPPLVLSPGTRLTVSLRF